MTIIQQPLSHNYKQTKVHYSRIENLTHNRRKPTCPKSSAAKLRRIRYTTKTHRGSMPIEFQAN